MILADRESKNFTFRGLEKALKIKSTEVRLFGKPSTRKYRRMGVALAKGKTITEARKKAFQAAKQIVIGYKD